MGMLRKPYLQFAKALLLGLTCALPGLLYAGDPIPGIDITIDQTTHGIKKKGTTNANGEVILSGFKTGPVVVTLSHKGKRTVIGKTGQDRIIIRDKTEATQNPIRIDLARYWVNQKMKQGSLKANHNTTRSNRLAPAHVDTKGPSGKARAQDHNTTRSNRTLRANNLDTDSDGDSIPTTKAQDYNSSRSNTTRAIEKEPDLDRDGIVDILPLGGGKIKVSVQTGN
jgi:hypothetical protein